MAVTEQIDQTIQQIEQLYHNLTGHPAPGLGEQPYAPIPPERDPLQYVQEQFNRLMAMLSPATTPSPTTPISWSPPFAVWATPQEYLVCVDLPGVDRDEVDVSMAQNQVQVTGRRSAPTAGDGQNARWSGGESNYGAFARTIPLPADLASDEADAKLAHGVLEIRIPRGQESSTARTIRVH